MGIVESKMSDVMEFITNGLILTLITFMIWLKVWTNTKEQHYILYTQDGNIECEYHNSRDLNNGWMTYHQGDDMEHVAYYKVDSILILEEHWSICGPKDPEMKYIIKGEKRVNFDKYGKIIKN